MNILDKIIHFKSFLEKNNIDYKRVIFVSFIEVLVLTIFSVGIPYLAKLEIDQLQYQSLTFLNLSAFDVFIFIVIIYFIFDYLNDYFSYLISVIHTKIYEKVSFNLVQVFIDRLSNSEYGKFFDTKIKTIIKNISSKLEYLLQDIITFFSDIFKSFFTLTAIFYIFYQINIYIVFVLLLGVLLQYKLENYIQFLNKKLEIKHIDKQINLGWMKRMLFWHPIESITNGMVYYLKNKLKTLGNDYIDERYEMDKLSAKYHTFSKNMSKIIEMIIKITVGYTIFYYGASIGTITMTILFSSQLTNIFHTILNFKKNLLELNYKLDFYFLFLDFTDNKYIGTIEKMDIRSINIRNLTFAYPNLSDLKNKYYQLEDNFTRKLSGNNLDYKKEEQYKNENVLENINVSFEKGKIYGIVGKNGAGKTTLLNLLLKAFNTNSIFYNDKSILEIKRSFFIKNVGIITQIPAIIPYTIRENITLGKPIDDEKIYTYLEKFNLREKIENLPKKLDSKIGEDIELSGGERQIIAILRILLGDYQILILDEGSNQLDVENENKLIQLLQEGKNNKIIIFVTHRMTVINKADYIYCLDKKTIKDAGTPEELVKKDSLFKKFYNLEINRI